jgi:hypothetical protein
MIKSIKYASVISAMLLLVGIFFKTMHWTGANILLSAGAFAGILFLISMIASVPAKLAAGFGKVNIVITSLILIIALLAFAFMIMHWPGAAKLIWFADLGILVAVVILLIDAFLEKDAAKWSMKLIAAFFALILLIVVMLT